MNCENCKYWITRFVVRYGDGTEIEKFKAVSGHGNCQILNIDTVTDFGCNRFEEGSIHLEVEPKSGLPWHYFKMIPCPDCAGKGDGARGHRCAGTGLVRLYDDGYVGDEQTRIHPKEKEIFEPPKCPGCFTNVDNNWKHCTACGYKLWAVAETEIIEINL